MIEDPRERVREAVRQEWDRAPSKKWARENPGVFEAWLDDVADRFNKMTPLAERMREPKEEEDTDELHGES